MLLCVWLSACWERFQSSPDPERNESGIKINVHCSQLFHIQYKLLRHIHPLRLCGRFTRSISTHRYLVFAGLQVVNTKSAWELFIEPSIQSWDKWEQWDLSAKLCRLTFRLFLWTADVYVSLLLSSSFPTSILRHIKLRRDTVLFVDFPSSPCCAFYQLSVKFGSRERFCQFTSNHDISNWVAFSPPCILQLGKALHIAYFWRSSLDQLRSMLSSLHMI